MSPDPLQRQRNSGRERPRLRIRYCGSMRKGRLSIGIRSCIFLMWIWVVGMLFGRASRSNPPLYTLTSGILTSHAVQLRRTWLLPHPSLPNINRPYRPLNLLRPSLPRTRFGSPSSRGTHSSLSFCFHRSHRQGALEHITPRPSN